MDLSLEFALKIIDYCELLEEKKKFIISKQLLRSGTSIGANIRESQNAESRTDFIHKLKIAAKEADETSYWLLLCEKSESYPSPKTLIHTNEEIQKILNSIIGTMKKKQ